MDSSPPGGSPSRQALLPGPVLSALLGDVGRTDVVAARLAGGRGRCAVVRVDFAEGPPLAVWVELTAGVRAPPLAIAAAAGRWSMVVGGAASEDLACRQVDGRRCAVRAWSPGPARWEDAAAVLAAALGDLAEGPDAPFGVGVSRGRFVPTRGTWAEEWLGLAAATHARAVATGADAGPLGRALLAGVQGASAALGRARSFGLVHGGLGPDAVAEGADGPRLTGWEDALVGDRLVDLASLLALPPGALGAVVRRAPDALVDVDPERLAAYHLTWCLSQLALVGESATLEGLGRLTALDRVIRHAREALVPGFVSRRLAEAAAAPDAAPDVVAPEAVPGLLHVVLASLATTDPPDPLWVASALGGVLLADRAGSAASALLDARTVTCGGPFAWHADRAPGALPPLPDRGLAGLLSITGRAAVERLGGDVPDGVLRGLERTVRAAAARERLEGPGASPLLGATLDLALGGEGALATLWDAARDLDPGVAEAPFGDAATLAAAAAGDDAGALVVWLLERARSRTPGLPGGGAWVLERGRSG